MRSIKTGANLGDHFAGSPPILASSVSTNENTPNENPPLKTQPSEDNSEEFSMDVAPDISLLTLNATGELRYLGPSSGSFFAKYASNFARSFLSDDAKKTSQVGSQPANMAPTGERFYAPTIEPSADASRYLTPQLSKYLLSCYSKWVQPMFALLDQSYVQIVLEPLSTNQNLRDDLKSPGHDSQRVIMIIYLLVLALGAVHVTPHEQNSEEQACYLEYQDSLSSKKLSPDSLFVEALDILDLMCPMMPPSIPLIQIILLICIYGGYKPSGNRQWQLSGIAIRVIFSSIFFIVNSIY